MARWQPPIPSGALWCKPMRELGTAKALIEYCYDIVDRDGWCKFKLVEVADMMDEPYINLKRWWKVLQDANPQLKFFSEIKNRGVAGLEVRINEQWLDRRILNARTESTEPRSTKEVSPVAPLDIDDQSRSTKEVSKEVSPVAPLDSGNKVLISTDQAGDECADAAAPRAPQKRSRKEQPPTPLPIREALASVCQIGKLSTREQHLQLNQSAAAIWRAESAQGHDPDWIAADIRYVAGYFAKNDWRGKKGDIPRPADIRENWQPAMHARASPPPSPGANIPVFHGSAEPPPAPRRKTMEELEELYKQVNGHYRPRRLPNA